MPLNEGWNCLDGVGGEGGWGCRADVRVAGIVGVVDVGAETSLSTDGVFGTC